MTARLVLATNNQDKFREIQEKLHPLPVVILSLADFPFVGKVEEDQPDLYGNAIKKAVEVTKRTGEWALADDTGLEVDALGGAPGALAARYSGPHATYESNCAKLLAEMENVPDGKRQARFRTVMCLRTHDGLFIALLVSVVVVVGALSFIPAVALGPLVEHLMMMGG